MKPTPTYKDKIIFKTIMMLIIVIAFGVFVIGSSVNVEDAHSDTKDIQWRAKAACIEHHGIDWPIVPDSQDGGYTYRWIVACEDGVIFRLAGDDL